MLLLGLTEVPCKWALQALPVALALLSTFAISEEDGSADARGKVHVGSTDLVGRTAEVALQVSMIAKKESRMREVTKVNRSMAMLATDR